MNKSLIPLLAVFICFSFACQSKNVKAKKQMIENRISELKNELGTTDGTEKQKNAGDSIIGIWEVNNEYYMGIYEIIKYQNQYYGKIHYFNDGKTEYKGNNAKNDYFLDDLRYENGKFSFAKIHMPDGSHYQVKILLQGDNIKVNMTIQGEAYQEIWKRKKIKSQSGTISKSKKENSINKTTNHERK